MQEYFNQTTGPKYTYPSNERIVELVAEFGTIKAVGDHLGIPRPALKNHIRRRPDLSELVKAAQHRWLPEEQRKANALARSRRWKQKNKDRVNAYARNYYHEHREQQLATTRRWQKENAEHMKMLHRRWKEANPNHKAEYYRRNPAKMRQQNEARRRGVKYTSEAMAYIPVLLNDPCSFCGEAANSIDHVEPVSAGGTSDWDNLTAACGRCNSSKGARSLLQYLLTF